MRFLAALVLITAPLLGDSLDDRVRAQMQWQRIPGLSLAVMKQGKVLVSRGYGLANVETQTAATADTVYKIGSLGKPFVAAAVMVLVQDGKLALTDPVRKHIPDAPESWRNITIRNLLEHTSGLVREFPAFDPYKVQPEAELIASTYALPLRFEPGSKWEYSNVGYYVLAEIIRKTSGEEWSSFIARRVFAPAGMKATRPTTREIVPNRARGYETRGGRLQNAEDWLAVRPSGAFLSTVNDFAKWDAALYADGMFRQMWTAGAHKPYGFGWFVDTMNGHRHIHHDGGVPGFVAEFHRFPDDGISVVVLANIGDRDLSDLALQVADRYIAGLLPPPEPAIADTGPELTARLRALLRDLPNGTFDASLFTATAASYLREDLGRGLAANLRAQGKLVAFDLLEERTEGELRVRRYRARYPHLTLFAVFKLDAQGRVAAWSLTD
jgi:D-alanyl-D-alanine carboxypeptidase